MFLWLSNKLRKCITPSSIKTKGMITSIRVTWLMMISVVLKLMRCSNLATKLWIWKLSYLSKARELLQYTLRGNSILRIKSSKLVIFSVLTKSDMYPITRLSSLLPIDRRNLETMTKCKYSTIRFRIRLETSIWSSNNLLHNSNLHLFKSTQVIITGSNWINWLQGILLVEAD